MPEKKSQTSSDDLKKSFMGLAMAGAVKSALSDLPKASIERLSQDAIELRMDKKPIAPVFAPKNIWSSIARRGLPRLAGGVGAGSLTFPIFMSGLKDIKDGDTQKRRATGVGKILASGAIYSGGKGAIEYALEEAQKGQKFSSSGMKNVVRKAFVGRGLTGLAAAGLTAGTIGYGLRKQRLEGAKPAGEKKKKSAFLPLIAAAGGIISMAKQFPETVNVERVGPANKWASYKEIIKKPRVWAPRTISRGLGGAFGTLILGGIAQKLLTDSKSAK